MPLNSTRNSAAETAQKPSVLTCREHYTYAMERLVDVVQDLSLARDLDTVTKIVRQAARELTGADGATFVLLDGDMCYYIDEDAIGPLWKGQRLPAQTCIGGWCMSHRQPVIIEDIYQDDRIPIAAYQPTFVKSLVMVPIRQKLPIGAIGNYWANHHVATPEEVKLLQALADATSVILENIQVYEELEKRVRDRTTQLEHANQELEAFSYSVSHDLRNPLTVIRGYSGILSVSHVNQLDEAGQTYLTQILEAAKRMSSQIDEMLILHRLSRTELRLETVNLSDLAHEIVSNLRNADPERQSEIHIREGLMIQGDRTLLRVVLENLLSNAWKYSAKRSHACIQFDISSEADGLTVFSVRDNGAGFDMSQADKLFKPFQRMHEDDEFKGTGVGLASVYRIIQRHGGRIWAEALVDQGATFYFSLPQSLGLPVTGG